MRRIWLIADAFANKLGLSVSRLKRMSRRIVASAISYLVAALACLSPAFSQSDIESFYRGHQITILVGFSAGGGFDLYARVLAMHMGKYLPGNPRIVVQNMPGAGSLTAALNILDIAPKDGSYIGIFDSHVPLYPILSNKKFDGSRFNWVGSVTNEYNLCIASAKSDVKSWSDMLTKTFVAGGDGSGLDVYPNLLKHLFGAKVKLVTGYPGSTDVKAAILRGELDGECGISYSTMKREFARELDNKEINILLQVSLQKNPDLPDVAFVGDIPMNPRQKEMLRLILETQEMARPFAAPSGIPAERLEALRAAFDKTVKDPDFLADAHKSNLDVRPMQGMDMNKLIVDLYKTPPDVVEETKAAIEATF